MNDLLFYSVSSLGGIGLASAGVLFVASKKFYLYQDPQIDQVKESLPGANCGACGFAGCQSFAEEVVKRQELSELNCPVGGTDSMEEVAAILGVEALEHLRNVAVLKCNGHRLVAPPKVEYQGATNCQVSHSLFAGSSGCAYGCLGDGDCVVVCDFGALAMDQRLGLPAVDYDKCTACGACVKACPRNLYELRPITQENQLLYVACSNTERGNFAKKNCAVACIGCSKCAKTADKQEVGVSDFLSYITPQVDLENLGIGLVDGCPTGAIFGINVDGVKDRDEKRKIIK
jgi:Na+-translocating ferredoxin:NAD+ oxidoreductase subunit B